MDDSHASKENEVRLDSKIIICTYVHFIIIILLNTFVVSRQSMENMFIELQREPSGEFQNFCRMSSTDFEYLLQKIGPTISKEDTNWRECIPAKIRLAVTLRFLTTGDSYRSLNFLFKISSQIISRIIPEVCAAINKALQNEVQVNKISFLT